MKSFRRKAILFFAHWIVLSGIASGQGTYQILHDTLSATGWYGGDNRDTGGPRSVGVGQGVRIDTPIVLTEFSFYFDSRFDYSMNPDGFGHDVTLVLNIRDSLGAILQTLATFVPASFESGWVTWSDINMSVSEGTFLIFTTYLGGAYDLNQYTSSNGADQFQLYTPGPRYGKDGVSDADMELWTDWVQHPSWDSMFWLEGTIQTVDVPEEEQLPEAVVLLQNYPNPFNPTTTIPFVVPAGTPARTNLGVGLAVSLQVYDLLGREVATLVNEKLSPGIYTKQWNAAGLPSGMYFYRLMAGGYVATRKLSLLK